MGMSAVSLKNQHNIDNDTMIEVFGVESWNRFSHVKKMVSLDKIRESLDRDHLETIYQLVRKSPQLVACGVKIVPDDMEIVNLRLKNMELRRKKKFLRRALARMCVDFDRINTNHVIRTSELELEIARSTQKISVIRNMESKSTEFVDLVSQSSADFSESARTPLRSMLKKMKDPRKKYRKVRVSFA